MLPPRDQLDNPARQLFRDRPDGRGLPRQLPHLVRPRPHRADARDGADLQGARAAGRLPRRLRSQRPLPRCRPLRRPSAGALLGARARVPARHLRLRGRAGGDGRAARHGRDLAHLTHSPAHPHASPAACPRSAQADSRSRALVGRSRCRWWRWRWAARPRRSGTRASWTSWHACSPPRTRVCTTRHCSARRSAIPTRSCAARRRALPAERQGPPQTEAVTAIAKTGGDEGAVAVGDLLGSGAATTAVQRSALLEAWRLGARAPIPTLMREARNPDPVARGNAIYALARLRTARGATRRIAPLLADGDSHVRVNALRALASFHDSTLAPLALPLTADPDVNVAVQAE